CTVSAQALATNDPLRCALADRNCDHTPLNGTLCLQCASHKGRSANEFPGQSYITHSRTPIACFY
ncbi:MAG: hypothetical protein ACKVHP_22780, partial [Verrucomicrobiales bacterium]